MAQTKIQTISFFALLLGAFLLLFFIFKPFLSVIFFAILLAIVFYPLYLRFHKHFKSESIASLMTVVLVIVCLVGLFLIFGQLLYNELASFYSSLTHGNFVFSNNALVEKLPVGLQEYANGISNNLDSYVSKFTTGAFQTVSSVLSNLAVFLLNLFLTFFALYYLLKDGGKLKSLISHLVPISTKQGHELVEKIIVAVNGVVKGTFFVALIQGVTALVGFLIFGVPNPLLWTGLVILASFIPNFGTAIVMAPIVIYLFITSSNTAAIGMAIWAGLAVGMIDNIVSPKLVGREAKIHPLVVLFSVLGGLQLFGILGFLFGPIVAAVFVVLLDIYANDFKEYLNN